MKCSNGLQSQRDEWVYNTSKDNLHKNMKRCIRYCNTQDPDNFIIDTSQASSWTKELSISIKKLPAPLKLNQKKVKQSLYRPFFKQYIYFDPIFIPVCGSIPSFFHSKNSDNLIIIVPNKINRVVFQH